MEPQINAVADVNSFTARKMMYSKHIKSTISIMSSIRSFHIIERHLRHFFVVGRRRKKKRKKKLQSRIFINFFFKDCGCDSVRAGKIFIVL
jgi:hypothetical protein